ncbi:MAG: hypothetical protein IMF02_08965, partial [Proteobacteria bacterium]|nr:hypothetical protein [Pseudomonadota bacterium]
MSHITSPCTSDRAYGVVLETMCAKQHFSSSTVPAIHARRVKGGVLPMKKRYITKDTSGAFFDPHRAIVPI